MPTPRLLTSIDGPQTLVTVDGNPYPVGVADDVGGGVLAFVSVKVFGAKGDDVTDDAPAFQAGLNALAGTGVALWVPAGTYVIGEALAVPSSTIVWGDSAATLKSTITAGVGPGGFGAIFTAIPAPNQNGVTIGALNINAAIGSRVLQFNVTGVLPTIGDWLNMLHGFSAQVFKVTNVALVAGTVYNVTIDREVLLPFTTADSGTAYTAIPQDIRIYGNGMTLTGTGDLYIELFAALNCEVRNLKLNASGGALRATTFVASFDTGSRNCTFDNLVVDGTGANAAMGGPVTEGGTSNLLRRIYCANMTGNGPALIDGIGCGLEDCSLDTGGGFGLAIGTQGASFGSFGCWMQNSFVAGATTQGFLFDKTQSCSGENLQAYACNIGVQVTANAVDATLRNVLTEDSTTGPGLDVHAYCIVRDLTCYESNGAGHDAVTVSGGLLLDGFDIHTGGTVNLQGVGINLNTGIARIRNGIVTLESTGAHIAIVVTALTAMIDEVDIANATTGGPTTYGVYVNGGTARLGTRVYADLATHPVTVASGQSNRGQVIANGAANVDVTWPDLNASDRVLLTMAAKGGAPSALPLITYTPGTKFTLQSFAGDTSTYDYVVQ